MPVDALKQRLIGALALLLLGAVAWFTLLSTDNPVDPMDRTTQIPPEPDIEPFTVPAPVAPRNIEPIGSEREAPPVAQSDAAGPATAAPAPAEKAAAAEPPAPQAAAPAERPATAKPTETFQLDRHGLPVAWVVQVGSFSARDNADRYRKTLQDKGFKAYSQPVKTARGTVYKVYVGPKLSRERAESQKKAIDQALKVRSLVVRFPVG